MENEKKFKLEELPDKGSEPELKIRPITKPTLEPRVEKLKKLDNAAKLENLSLRWHFDNPEKHWSWLWSFLFLAALQKSGVLINLLNKNKSSSEEIVSFLGQMALDMFEVDYLVAHPLLLALLIPLFFKFRSPSPFFFDITFDGVETVRKVHFNKHEGNHRVKMKWVDIVKVTKTNSFGRDILILTDQSNECAEIIWDIEDIKKNVIKRILRGLLSAKHPLRQFIEKDVV